MRPGRRPLFSTLLAIAWLAAPGSAQDARRPELREVLARTFPQAERVERTLAVPTAEQREDIARRTGLRRVPRVLRWWTAIAGDRVLGYAVVGDVRGKSRAITFLLAVDPALTIRSVEILAYRETHGGEVRRAAWRAQFVGKGPGSPLRVGRDLRNIAGATISCRAVAAGVRRALAWLAVLRPPRAQTPVPAAPAGGSRGAPPADAGPMTGPVRRSRLLMGTTLEITAYASRERIALAAIEAAWAEVARLEAVLSDYRDDSELSRLNAAAGRGPVPCSEDLRAFLTLCRELTDASGGALDPGAGGLYRLWREAARAGRQPAAAAIDRARATPGMHGVTIAAERVALAPGVVLDPGAVGKGFALDRAAAVLRRRGVTHALLSFGGQVLAAGPQPDGSPWRVVLRDARSGAPGRPVLRIERGSVATTADYERGIELEGRRVSHVIDPRTGRPVEGMLAVTVFARDAASADAWSTALFAAGPEEAGRLAREHGLAARIESSESVAVTASFKRLLGTRAAMR